MTVTRVGEDYESYVRSMRSMCGVCAEYEAKVRMTYLGELLTTRTVSK